MYVRSGRNGFVSSTLKASCNKKEQGPPIWLVHPIASPSWDLYLSLSLLSIMTSSMMLPSHQEGPDQGRPMLDFQFPKGLAKMYLFPGQMPWVIC